MADTLNVSAIAGNGTQETWRTLAHPCRKDQALMISMADCVWFGAKGSVLFGGVAETLRRSGTSGFVAQIVIG